jgi:peptidoglycan/LPS O-acetylase OafA/YrhL
MKKPHRFHEIDLLRFIAAFSVLLFHYTFRGSGPDHRSLVAFPELGPIFKYGYLGVELFFIVSGFVIFLTALNRNAREFVVSRVTRLYPAYWSCVTLTFLAILVLGQGRYSVTLRRYLMNLTMLQEFAHVRHIDGVYWTLTIELKFYLLVFLLMLVGQTRRLPQFLGLWLVISAFLDYHDGYAMARFFLVPGYSYLFIAGATSLLIWLHGVSAYRLLLFAASYVGAVHFAIADSKSFADFFRTDFNPVVITLTISLFFASFLLVALGKTKSLGRPVFVTIGALTYPLYLLHQNIGFMIFNAAPTYIPRYILLVSITAFVIGIAYAVNRWIERRYSCHLRYLMTRVLFLTGHESARQLRR